MSKSSTRTSALLFALLSPMFFAAPALGQDLDAKALIAALAQPAPDAIDFTEVRFSPMLNEPLVISGVLSATGPRALDRQVRIPYSETTQIRDDSVSVIREGEAERRFALRRAPELQGMVHAFAALLAGNYAALDENFTIEAHGSAQAWQLDLMPRARRLRERISLLHIDGQANQTRCFWLLGADADASFSVMLLGPLAQVELPAPLTREWLQTACTS